ncbi:uncharacterized protein LOC111383865 [Olea europaea var. sylvestris]|uniref:uncharacterized protein LOC111383865 n=1 Tax=Olea europaea var. sylvestris TaxID=158386 RepID=UPI000C1CD859|nr:uncharacterized protein LOC111383865 [Olea europaea var. sylvestris]
MKKEFDMSDLGCMKYFLGVEVVQSSAGIFISQKKYANEILERFGMDQLSLIACFMEAPTVLHQQAVKRVFRYLKGTTELGILYKKEGEESLLAYSYSDYAGDLDGRKSTSGYVFKMSSAAVAWSSKRQPVVSLSTTEAEFIAAAA